MKLQKFLVGVCICSILCPMPVSAHSSSLTDLAVGVGKTLTTTDYSFTKEHKTLEEYDCQDSTTITIMESSSPKASDEKPNEAIVSSSSSTEGAEYIDTSLLKEYTQEIGKEYNIDPWILYALVERESSRNIYAENGVCRGLCQVSEYWHADRMENLGITDIYDPYSNITLAADYLSDLLQEKDDIAYCLMRYNMKISTANELYEQGVITDYASGIIARADELRAANK